jgi:hypothetical protein
VGLSLGTQLAGVAFAVSQDAEVTDVRFSLWSPESQSCRRGRDRQLKEKGAAGENLCFRSFSKARS